MKKYILYTYMCICILMCRDAPTARVPMPPAEPSSSKTKKEPRVT